MIYGDVCSGISAPTVAWAEYGGAIKSRPRDPRQDDLWAEPAP